MASNRKAGGSLKHFQKTIARAVMQPLLEDEGMAQVNEETAEAWIKPNDRLPSFERLEIYNQQYWWRIQAAFADDFRALQAVLGNKTFDHLTAAYLQAYPSSSWNLGRIGSRLVEFLTQNPRLTHPRSLLALQVAQVEWARIVAFEGAQKPVVSPKKLSQTPPDKLTLALQPTITLLELDYPVDELMSRLKRKEAATGSNAAAPAADASIKKVTIPKSRAPIFLIVHRVDYSVYFKRLEPEAWRLLAALQSGSTLGSACEQAFADTQKTPETCVQLLQTWFSQWTQFGWFCASRSKPH